MPYNETFEKLKAAQNPAFAEEIEAVKDNQTFFIGAYEASPEGNIPKGDFNEIFQALLNNDKALKKLAEAIQARTITAGKGLQGGGSLAANRTINVVSADDSLIVGEDSIAVNTYNDVNSTSPTQPVSARVAKKLQDEKMPYTGGTFTGDVKMAGGKAITGAYNYGFKVLKQDGGSVYALLAQSDGKLHVGYTNSIPIKLDSQNITVDGGFATTSQDLRGAIKELNDGKISGAGLVNDLTSGGTNKALTGEMGKKLNDEKLAKSGGQMTGQLEMTGQNYIVGSYGWGYALKNKKGDIAPLAYVSTKSGDSGILVLGNIAGYDAMHVSPPTKFNSTITVSKYLKVQDYYNDVEGASSSNIWFNKDNSTYAPNTLYIDNTLAVRINRHKVLTEANSGIIREKLYEGVLNKGTTVTFSKSIKEFDAIEVLSGDQFFSFVGSDGRPSNIENSDVVSNTYDSNLLLSPYPFFQSNYIDTQGGTRGNSIPYTSVMRMLSETQMKLVQIYAGNNIYSNNNSHLAIYGVKYSFGGKQ